MTYGKAALVNLVLLPLINLLALPVGIVLAMKAAKNARRTAAAGRHETGT